MRSIPSLVRFAFKISYNDEHVDDDVELNVLGCRADVLGINCDQKCVCMVQCYFTPTETIRLMTKMYLWWSLCTLY